METMTELQVKIETLQNILIAFAGAEFRFRANKVLTVRCHLADSVLKQY